MRLTVIGCSGSYPGPDSAASCYLLESEYDDGTGPRTWRLLLDLGSGALGTLQRFVDPLDIDGVVFSHLHADHCLDMCGFYVLRKYHPAGPWPPIPVWGPDDTADRLARAYDMPTQPGMSREFDFRPLSSGLELGPFGVQATPVQHPVEAYGVRVAADGVTLAYTGDSGVCPGLDTVAHDVDLLLAEASYDERASNAAGVHLTGADSGRLAARAGVRRLVLTHVPPWHDPHEMVRQAAEHYDGPIDLAAVGATYDLTTPRRGPRARSGPG